MEYVYATLTLNELGQELNEENITAVLDAAGADVVESRVKAIVAALEDVDLDELGTDAGIPPASPPEAGTPDADTTADSDDTSERPDDSDTPDTATGNTPRERDDTVVDESESDGGELDGDEPAETDSNTVESDGGSRETPAGSTGTADVVTQESKGSAAPAEDEAGEP